MNYRALFAHPDAKAAMARAIGLLADESDRGTVIIALDLIDKELEALFEAAFPSSLSKAERKKLLNHHGVLSTVSGKAAIAHGLRLIGRRQYQSISALRKLRNEVAHSADAFRLEDHKEDAKRVVEPLGKDVSPWIADMAMKMLVMYVLHGLREKRKVVDGKEVPPIESYQDAMQWLLQNLDVLDSFEKSRPRWELGVTAGLLCGAIVVFREELAQVLPDDRLLSHYAPEKPPQAARAPSPHENASGLSPEDQKFVAGLFNLRKGDEGADEGVA